MRSLTILGAATALLAGCVSPEQVQANYVAKATAYCESNSIAPSDPRFNQCVATGVQDQQKLAVQQREAAARAVAGNQAVSDDAAARAAGGHQLSN